MKPTVMVIGIGDLGSVMLEFLAREEQLGKIVAADKDKTRAIARCNLTRLSAMAQGYSPSISFVHLDINDKKTVMEIVPKVHLLASEKLGVPVEEVSVLLQLSTL